MMFCSPTQTHARGPAVDTSHERVSEDPLYIGVILGLSWGYLGIILVLGFVFANSDAASIQFHLIQSAEIPYFELYLKRACTSGCIA